MTLSETIGFRIPLLRRGADYVGVCPFCDAGPTLAVSDDPAFFHCFGCGAHGDAAGFIAAMDSRDA